MKIKFIFIIILVCLFNVWVLTATAAKSSFFEGLETTAEQGAGYQPMPKEGGANRFISIFLGRGIWPLPIGAMATIILAYGGFIWMMARGREEEVERAKTIIRNTLIALVVIFLAWAIVQLVMPLWKLVTGKLSGV